MGRPETFSSPAPAPTGLNGGEVLVASLAYLLGSTVEIDGTVGIAASPAGRVRVDSVNNTTVSGVVTASSAVEVFTGVSPSWTTTKLRDDPITIAATELASGSNVLIEGSGQLLASTGNVTVEAGGDAQVQALSQTQNGTQDLIVPVVTQTSTPVTIVTGSSQVLTGTHTISVVNWVTTTGTITTGYDRVVSGTTYDTMSLALVQIGYVNPTTGTIRTYFIEGPGGDYSNSNSAIGLAGPLTNNNVPVEFEGLSDHDKNAVLKYLGYQPLYALEASNGIAYHVQDGTTTTSNFDPNSVWDEVPSGVTFADHSGGDTITLSSGNWDTTKFSAGEFLHISNTTGNNTSGGTHLYQIKTVSSNVLTLTVGNMVTAETDSNSYIYHETIQTGPSTATDLSSKEILMSPSAASYLSEDTSVGGAGTSSTVPVAGYTDRATVQYAQNNANHQATGTQNITPDTPYWYVTGTGTGTRSFTTTAFSYVSATTKAVSQNPDWFYNQQSTNYTSASTSDVFYSNTAATASTHNTTSGIYYYYTGGSGDPIAANPTIDAPSGYFNPNIAHTISNVNYQAASSVTKIGTDPDGKSITITRTRHHH